MTNIQHLGLEALCTYIHNVYSHDTSKVSGETFALLAKKLIAQEAAPGGPYRDETGSVTVALNGAIARLFRAMHVPLPNVEMFLQGAPQTHLAAHNQTDNTAKKYLHNHSASERTTPYTRAYNILNKTHEPLRSQALNFLERVAHADKTNEIAQIAAFAANSLNVTPKNDTLDILGEANIYGWMAYMIYDHIIDGASDTSLLPVANVAMRLSVTSYKKVVPPNAPLQHIIDKLFNDIDEANAWELAMCRFTVKRGVMKVGTLPNYGHNEVLAQRSGIHILGPLIIAQASSLNASPRKIAHFTHGLRQYLIARQLSDDIHDWRDDLAAGHITAVVSQLLSDDAQTSKTFQIKTLTQKLQRKFLQTSMSDICRIILHHTNVAKTELAEADCTNGPLIALIERIERMTTQSLAQRARFLDFKASYSNRES